MEEITLSGENFTLRVSFEVTREDIALPVNTSLFYPLSAKTFPPRRRLTLI
ncbi:MAG: hypothetical protein LUG88_01505 [Clostridia bacterium]|nr:hypothetical protein [Clostridia bacterium]